MFIVQMYQYFCDNPNILNAYKHKKSSIHIKLIFGLHHTCTYTNEKHQYNNNCLSITNIVFPRILSFSKQKTPTYFLEHKHCTPTHQTLTLCVLVCLTVTVEV